MSITQDGCYIECDGEGCEAMAPFPVTRQVAQMLRKWLFVKSDHTERHYCPHCAPYYLAEVTPSRDLTRRA